jgi:putative MFS transporter
VRAFVERLERSAGVPSDPDYIDAEQMRALRTDGVRKPVPSRLTVFQRPYLRRTLASWAPWTGMTLYFYAFLLYGPSLLVERGLAENRALLATGIMMATAGIGTLLQGYLADRLGRKPLLWSYGFLGAVGLVLLGYAEGTGAVLLAGFLAAFFGLGVHGVTKIYIAEQYPTYLRGTGAGMAEGVCRFLSGVLAAYYIPYIFDRFGVEGVFWIVGVVAAISMIPMIVLGRETKGMSVEETGATTEAGTESLVVPPERHAGAVGVASARAGDG